MKEPQPDENGMVCWNDVRLADALVDFLKERGYKWDEEMECYRLSYEDQMKADRNPAKLAPISFHIDEFRRATHQ